MKIKTYNTSEMNPCREASKISATILDELNDLITVGITTDEIDNYCLNRIKKLGGSPAPLFYRCLLYTSPSPRDGLLSRMPSSA